MTGAPRIAETSREELRVATIYTVTPGTKGECALELRGQTQVVLKPAAIEQLRKAGATDEQLKDAARRLSRSHNTTPLIHQRCSMSGAEASKAIDAVRKGPSSGDDWAGCVVVTCPSVASASQNCEWGACNGEARTLTCTENGRAVKCLSNPDAMTDSLCEASCSSTAPKVSVSCAK